MRTSRAQVLIAVLAGLALSGATQPVFAQAETAAEAALNMANILDGAGGGISSDDLVTALEDAAAAGQPMALWQLGLMYESGEGVQKDPVKAFGYFSQIADEHADAAPKSVDAEIVAQSFVKVGEYYRAGLPAAGVPKDIGYSNKLMMHAASYFGDADAQYRVGNLYQDDDELGDNPLQSARWLSLAARKGHAGAQAKLGNIMFNGDGIDPNPEEGLMWLTVASRRAVGTPDEGWINELLQNAMSVANPDQRKRGIELADTLSPKFGGLVAE